MSSGVIKSRKESALKNFPKFSITWRGRTKTTTCNTEGMVRKIALFGGLKRHFCHEKNF